MLNNVFIIRLDHYMLERSTTWEFIFTDTANNLVHPPLIPYTDFYNSTLDHIDLMEEYHTWQSFGNSHRYGQQNLSNKMLFLKKLHFKFLLQII